MKLLGEVRFCLVFCLFLCLCGRKHVKAANSSNQQSEQLAPTEKTSGILLTEGEMKRALSPSKDERKRQRVVFVTSTCTISSLPTTTSSTTTTPIAEVAKTVCSKPKPIICFCPKVQQQPVKKPKCPKKLVIVSHNYTITEQIPCHQTISHTVLTTVPVTSTICNILPITSSISVFCTTCVTISREPEVEPPETFTLTSTQLAIRRVKACCCTTSLPASTTTLTETISTAPCGCNLSQAAPAPAPVMTKTCQVTATAYATKKVIVKLENPNSPQETKDYVPWWLRGLKPNYDQAKAEAYKKQLNENKNGQLSKCMVSKLEKEVDIAQ